MRVTSIRLTLLLFCLLLGGKYAFGQPDTWAIGGGSPTNDNIGDMITDADGNTYMAMNFRDSLIWQGDTVWSDGETDVFLVKIKPNGSTVWSQRLGWTADDFVEGISLSSTGRLMLVGHFVDSTVVGTDTLFGNYIVESFNQMILRFDTAGTYLDHFESDGPGGEFAYAVAIDGNNESYFAGKYRDFYQLEFDTLLNAGKADINISKFNTFLFPYTNGSKWPVRAGSRKDDAPTDLSIYNATTVLVTGYFQDTADFNDSAVFVISAGGQDMFLAAYNEDGTFLWVKQAANEGFVNPASLIIDQAGGFFYIAGTFQDSLAYNGLSVLSNGLMDGFILKTTATGNPVWLKTVGGAGYDGINDLKFDANGDLVLTGYYQNTATIGGNLLTAFDEFDQQAYIAKFTPSGNGMWATAVGGDSYDEGQHIGADANGYVYASGIFSNSSHFGQVTLLSSGGHDAYLLRLNEEGQVFLAPTKDPETLIFGHYPNPADAQATLYFEMDQPQVMHIEILDLQGRLIGTPMVEQLVNRGRSEIEINLSDLLPGMYIYRLSSENSIMTGKLLIVR